MNDPLLFVDTNILLDFYRAQKDAGLHLLGRLDGLHDRIICTYQVEMEFKKNRQSAIRKSMEEIKYPEMKFTSPAFLSDAKTLDIMKRQLKDTKARIDNFRDRIKRIFANPIGQDKVYQTAQRLFSAETTFNLRRDNSRKHHLRRLAWKRFILGYPPRKKNDTSTGDAINWEWIVECVSTSKRDVIIVSRDADFGETIDGVSYVNDWLLQELKERTSNRRRVVLYDRLSAALKKSRR